MAFMIATQYLGTYVGANGKPETFETRAAARKRAAELQESTPSKYGRLLTRKA